MNIDDLRQLIEEYGGEDGPALSAALDTLSSKLESWERSAQEGHPNPCTLGPLCPYCEIERLSSKLHRCREALGNNLHAKHTNLWAEIREALDND